jgi:putative hemolysin
MMALVGQIKRTTQLRWKRVHRFKTKVQLKIDFGPYTIKTAETMSELLESFKLRHEVFHQEFRGVDYTGLDFDKFDYYFDHLIIIHREQKRIIGTYRLKCSDSFSKSYTGLEFDLSSLSQHTGPYLELGRACIHSEFRKGSVISLLWRGIAEYMKLSNSSILFGCSSLKVNTAREAALVYTYLIEKGAISNHYHCRPTQKFTMHNLEAWITYFLKGLSENQKKEAESLIPSLLKSYLKLGAKIACEPAFDEEFDCIDLLTVLKKSDMARVLADRFQVDR